MGSQVKEENLVFSNNRIPWLPGEAWQAGHGVDAPLAAQFPGVPGRVPASRSSWLRQLPPFLPPAGPDSASSVCAGSFETKF